ncbi:MAG: hypothetical protein Q9220_001785 [cf. Caloplaca sp. 1 TL-2023]
MAIIAATIVLLIPTIQAGLLRRDSDFPTWTEANPFFIDKDSCKSASNPANPSESIDQASALYDAATDANYLAHAGIIAAANPALPPFNAFFRPEDVPTVIKNLQTVIDITENSKKLDTHIVFNCNSERYCKDPKQWGAAVFFGRHVADGPAEEERSQWEVSICAQSLDNLPRNPPACSDGATVGLPSRGWVGIKYLLQLWDLIQPTVGNLAYGPMGCRDLLLQDAKGEDMVRNAESYAYMASAAYDLGLYNKGPYKGPECREKWVDPAKIVLPGWVGEGVTVSDSAAARRV